MLDFKLWFLVPGISLLVIGIAGNIYWTQQNRSMTKEQCFLINYWLYVSLSGLGLILVLASALIYWWQNRKSGSGLSSYGTIQYGRGLVGGGGEYGFGYFE